MTAQIPQSSVLNHDALTITEKIGLLFHPMILLGDELPTYPGGAPVSAAA